MCSHGRFWLSMTWLWKFNMRSLLNLFSILFILNYSNAASVIGLSQDDRVWPNSNLTDLSAVSASRRFIDAIKDLNSQITAQSPRTFLVGVRAKYESPTRYTHVMIIFTNIARSQDKGLVVTLAPDRQWRKPVPENIDFGVGNKYLLGTALSFDITDAQNILKMKYPRAQYTAFYLYWPRQLGGLSDQPYWIFAMTRSILWDKYLWVGTTDFTVSATNSIPESVTRGSGGQYLAVSWQVSLLWEGAESIVQNKSKW